MDPSALRRFAQVSDVIPPGEFQWMMRLRSPRGAPLTWSHVELLARLRSAEKRRESSAFDAVVDESFPMPPRSSGSGAPADGTAESS